jgi:hypothetical protein
MDRSTAVYRFAAGILAPALVAGCAIASPATTGAPSPTTSRPTVKPSMLSTAPAERSQRMLTGGGDRVPITVTIPASDWSGQEGAGILLAHDNGDPPDGAGMIAFNDGEYLVYADPCKWSSTRPATAAATVDEVVTALASQASRDASAPEDITVSGHAGRKLVLHVPGDADFSACDEGAFATFGVAGDDEARIAQGPGQIEEVWVVDVDGRVALLVPMYFPQTTQAVLDQLQRIVASVSFE